MYRYTEIDIHTHIYTYTCIYLQQLDEEALLADGDELLEYIYN